MNNSLIAAINNIIKEKSIYGIECLNFIYLKNSFFKILNNSKFEDMEELKIAGKNLNRIQDELKKNINNIKSLNKFHTFNSKLYALGLSEIISKMPENYRNNIFKYSFTCLNSNIEMAMLYGMENIFNQVEDELNLIMQIDKINGEAGVLKYLILNKKIMNISNTSIYDLYNKNFISLDLIFKITSCTSKLSSKSSEEIAKEILNLNKSSDFSGNNDSYKIIYL